EELREVVMLRFAHGFTAAEAATALGIPEGTVKTRQRTALERLRDVLTRGGFASTPALIDLEGSLHQGAAQITVPETVLLTLETAIMASIGPKTAVGSAVLVLLLILLLTGSFGFVGWMMLGGDPPVNSTEQGPLARSQP